MAISNAGRVPRGGTRERRALQRLKTEQVAGIPALQSQQSVASATAIDLSAAGDTCIITGTTTITSIADMPSPYTHGVKRFLRFAGALTLTHSAGLILQTGANITTAAGDSVWANWEADGIWRLSGYVLASGVPLGVVPITKGGTGQVTAGPAKDALTVQGANIALASTTNLATATGDLVTITGDSGTCTSFGTAAAGVHRSCRFSGAGNTLTHNATSLRLPTGANIVNVTGDRFDARSLGSGNWEVTDYIRADGSILAPSLLFRDLDSLAYGPELSLGLRNYVGTTTGVVRGMRMNGYNNRAISNHRLTANSSGYAVGDTAGGVGTIALVPLESRGNPLVHTDLSLYHSTNGWMAVPCGTRSLTLAVSSGSVYDIFAYIREGTITAATNATPIVITSTAHGLADGEWVYIEGVAGNTAANGVFAVNSPTADTFELKISSGTVEANTGGNGAYTSGGKWYAVGIELSTAWGSPTTAPTRGWQDGVVVKLNDGTRKHMGFVYGSASNETKDEVGFRYLMNRYNKVGRKLYVSPAYADDNAATSFNHTNTTWGQVNAGTGGTIKFVSDGYNVSRFHAGFAMIPQAGCIGQGGIGIDSTTNPSVAGYHGLGSALLQVSTGLDVVVSEGYHTAEMLAVTNAGTMTVYADVGRYGAAADVPLTYMGGSIMG